MLSWSRGELPVAVVRGSKRDDGKLLYLSDKDHAPADAFCDVEMLDGCLQPIPAPGVRQVTYTAGQAGSGKSTWSSNYIAEWCHQHPGRPVFIVSRVTEDSAYEDIPHVERIPADQFLDDPPNTDSFPEDCLVLFDDIDTYPDKKVREAVQFLRNDLLEVGRHKMIQVCQTCHNLINGHASRIPLNESHWITVFPKGGSLSQLRYLCRNYLGMDPKETTYLKDLPSRWVSIYRNYPGVVIYSTGAYTASGGVHTDVHKDMPKTWFRAKK